MKKALKIVLLLLSLCLMISSFSVGSFATESTYVFKGTDSSAMNEILVNGKGTGVILHQLHTNAATFITANKKINILEVPMNDYVTIELSNNGAYNSKTSNTKVAIENYDQYNRVVLAGTNATWYHTTNRNLYCDSTKNIYVSWGMDVSYGEILNTPFSSAEAKYIDGGFMDGPYCFAVTKDNKAMVGKPSTTVKIYNETKNTNYKLDGINRAPVDKSAMIYNNRFSEYTYVNADALEVIIKVDGSNKFYFGQDMTGTVFKVIPSGSTEREPLQEGYITLTVRGSTKQSKFSDYQPGDKIKITTSVKDSISTNHSDWMNVKTCCGGQIMVMSDGKIKDSGLATVQNQYPAMIAGVKKDGTVVICNVTADTNGTYSGLNFSELNKFCKAVGYYDCFLLDGGGSATLLTLEDGNYVDRGCYSDGEIRSVVNSLLVVYDSAGNAKQFPAPTPEPTAEPTTEPTGEPSESDDKTKSSGCGVIINGGVLAIIGAGCLMIGKRKRK